MMTEKIIKEDEVTENNLETRLEKINFKAFAGLVLFAGGTYLLGYDLPPEVAIHQMKAYQLLSGGLTMVGISLSASAIQNYNDLINKK